MYKGFVFSKICKKIPKLSSNSKIVIWSFWNHFLQLLIKNRALFTQKNNLIKFVSQLKSYFYSKNNFFPKLDFPLKINHRLFLKIVGGEIEKKDNFWYIFMPDVVGKNLEQICVFVLCDQEKIIYTNDRFTRLKIWLWI